MRLFVLALALAACGSGSTPDCIGFLCVNPSATVFLDVRDSAGATVASPQIFVNGNAVAAQAVTQESLPDGGTQACACQEFPIPPGASVIDVVTSGARGRLSLDAGVTPGPCCKSAETRLFDAQITLQ